MTRRARRENMREFGRKMNPMKNTVAVWSAGFRMDVWQNLGSDSEVNQGQSHDQT
jgi:hypothetical protein